MIVHVHETVILFSLCKWQREKCLFLLLNGMQYARLKIAVRSMQGQKKVVRSTQGEGGCHPQR